MQGRDKIMAEEFAAPVQRNGDPATTDLLTCRPDATIREILARIERASPNLFQVVLDDDRRVLGTVTDGDIRRAMLASVDLEEPVSRCMNAKPRVATQAEVDTNQVVIDTSFFLPGVDGEGRLVQILTRQRHAGAIGRVLVMAGGFGRRLGDYTKERPKPLLEVADKPVLEHVLLQLEKAGIPEVHIAVHYLAEQIAAFIDARDNRANIRLINETEPLGTAGALGQMPANSDGPVLVINGDVLTEVDLKALTEFHFRHGYDGTVGAAPYEVDIPYGVLRHDDSGLFTGVDEKPTYQYLVAGGIYLLSPRIVGLVPTNRPVDMPEILEMARRAGFRLGIFPVHEYWRDIGRPADLKSAHDERSA
jgi:dTDP-glucose pyrophosphorylase/CBS domain-containing protein